MEMATVPQSSDFGLEQLSSPLFGTLPYEVRYRIFEFVLVADYDQSKPYRQDRKFYRPGFHCHRRIDIALLLTCRRIYLEARTLPVSVNEHVFWLFNGPWKSVGKTSPHTARWSLFYSRLTSAQKTAVRNVRVFAQQFYLESVGTRGDLESISCPTRRLTITLRHADWWSWESPPASSDRLGICPWRTQRTSCQQMLGETLRPSLTFLRQHMTPDTWGGLVCQVNGLKEFELELETDVLKKNQLETVVERAKHWRFPLRDGLVLIWTGTLNEWTWEGLKVLQDDTHLLRSSLAPDTQPKRTYYVVNMTWKASSVLMEDE